MWDLAAVAIDPDDRDVAVAVPGPDLACNVVEVVYLEESWNQVYRLARHPSDSGRTGRDHRVAYWDRGDTLDTVDVALAVGRTSGAGDAANAAGASGDAGDDDACHLCCWCWGPWGRHY